MKKILSIVIAAIFILSMTAVATSARSYNPVGNCNITFTVKHANPANVVKDGIIGEGEYERLDVDLDPDTSCLNLAFGENASMYSYAEEMLPTMEYYFSWDEVHGFNFAVKCKPPVYEQKIPQGTGDKPLDDFMYNIGLQAEFSPAETIDTKDGHFFYFSISKNAQTGEYYEGHWGQFGYKGNYDPTPGTDYEVAYNADGTITYEWSIPLEYYSQLPTEAGTNVYFTLDVAAGTDAPDNLGNDCYAVSLGDWGFLVSRTRTNKQVVATLSDEQLAGGSSSGDDSTNPGTNPSTDDPSTEPSTDTPGTEPKTDDPSQGNDNPSQGNDNPSQGNNNPSQGNKAPSTADPIVIATVASAVSALGFAVSKKRR